MAEEPSSTAALVGAAVEQVQEIVRSEMRLAAAEMKDKAKQAGRAGALLAGGAGVAVCGGAFLMVFVYKLLSRATGRPWLAALSLGAGMEVLAGVLIEHGRQRLAAVDLAPKATLRSVAEDVETVREKM